MKRSAKTQNCIKASTTGVNVEIGHIFPVGLLLLAGWPTRDNDTYIAIIMSHQIRTESVAPPQVLVHDDDNNACLTIHEPRAFLTI